MEIIKRMVAQIQILTNKHFVFLLCINRPTAFLLRNTTQTTANLKRSYNKSISVGKICLGDNLIFK